MQTTLGTKVAKILKDGRIAIPILLVIFTSITTTIISNSWKTPFFYLFIATATSLLLSLYWLRGIGRHIAWNLAIVFICLLGFEIYLGEWPGTSRQKIETKVTPTKFRRKDPILGYAFKKDQQIHKTKTFKGETIYDVHYTLDSHGRRKIPEVPGEDIPAVLFFGCSFTFGSGLEDHETLPWQFQELSGNQVQAINFGHPGYGPHQSLAMLENQHDLEVISDRKPIAAIYSCISDHVNRAAGRAHWDPSGPHYQVNPDGSCSYVGPFQTEQQEITHRFLIQSGIYKTILTRKRYRYSESDIQRFVGILTKMQDTIRQRYQIDLEILLWPDHAIEQLQDSLEEANFKIIKVDEIIPEIHNYKKRQPFIVHAKDSHPSALSNQLLAAELLRHLKINNPAFLSGNPNEQHQKTKSD